MRRWQLALGAAVACLALGVAGFAVAADFTVTLKSTGPQPATETVAWGDTVTLSNADTVPLQVTSKLPTLTSPSLAPGASLTNVFNAKIGSYTYTVISGKNKTDGKIVVTLSGTVALAAKPAAIVYGKRVFLTGTSTILGVPVVLQQEVPHTKGAGGVIGKGGGGGGGTPTWKTLATVPTAADGSFHTSLRPIKHASYRMTTAAGQLASNTVSVVVKPELTVQVAPLHTRTGAPVVVTATVHPANAATEVLLTQSESKGARKWKVVGTGKVRSGVAVIRWTAPSGESVVRVELRKGQLTSGYEGQTSREVVLNAANAPSVLHVEAVSAVHASKTVSKFVPTKLKATNGRITVEMRNATSVKRGIAIKGNGVDVVGSVVGKGGVSSVTAVLKPGTYEYFDPVARHAQQGMRGKLVVS